MTIDRALALKTDQRMLESIQRAASKQVTAEELLAQRVSFVYGSMDNKSTVTKDRVRQVILGLAGTANAR